MDDDKPLNDMLVQMQESVILLQRWLTVTMADGAAPEKRRRAMISAAVRIAEMADRIPE